MLKRNRNMFIQSSLIRALEFFLIRPLPLFLPRKSNSSNELIFFSFRANAIIWQHIESFRNKSHVQFDVHHRFLFSIVNRYCVVRVFISLRDEEDFPFEKVIEYQLFLLKSSFSPSLSEKTEMNVLAQDGFKLNDYHY